MTTRRTFLASLLASGLAPQLTWADAGRPQYLTTGRELDGAFYLYGLAGDGETRFRLPLPARGHAATAHPTSPEAVVFARRPGRFALVIDCVSGDVIQQLDAPEGRHFYGHGAFSRDGATLLTTENDYDNGTGIIGLWARNDGYKRIGEFSSAGVGPHEMLRIPGADIFAVANGGIETHPDTGRVKLNLPTMQSNLSYITLAGEVLDQMTLDQTHQLNSIRHLSVTKDGLIGFAMQWQGDVDASPTLTGLHQMYGQPRLLNLPTGQTSLNGYAGSIAFGENGQQIAVTSPRGGVVHRFDTQSGTHLGQDTIADVCGLAMTDTGFICFSGQGGVMSLANGGSHLSRDTSVAWDNHAVYI